MRLLRNRPFRIYPPVAEGSTIPAAVHVIRGDSAGGTLKTVGATPLICAPDNLALGPSSWVPRKHRRLRLHYWRTERHSSAREEASDESLLPPGRDLISARGLGRAVLSAERGRVLLWASGCWNDLLFLGWALDALDRAGIALDRVAIAGPRSAAFPLGWLNPNQIARFGGHPRALGREQAIALRRLWKAFTAATPGPLARLRELDHQPLPTLRREASLYAAFLPRSLGRHRRRLHLPEIDAALLSALSEREWRSLPNLLRPLPPRARWPTSAVFAMLRAYGDFFIGTRLLHWAHAPSRAVECEERPGRYPLAYRLTAKGKVILDAGICDVATLPRTQVGGYEITRKNLWVCAVQRGGWTLRRA